MVVVAVAVVVVVVVDIRPTVYSLTGPFYLPTMMMIVMMMVMMMVMMGPSLPSFHLISLFIRDCRKCAVMVAVAQFRSRDCHDIGK